MLSNIQSPFKAIWYAPLASESFGSLSVEFLESKNIPFVSETGESMKSFSVPLSECLNDKVKPSKCSNEENKILFSFVIISFFKSLPFLKEMVCFSKTAFNSAVTLTRSLPFDVGLYLQRSTPCVQMDHFVFVPSAIKVN